MKKRILLFTLAGGLAFFMLSSYTVGPARDGFDCLGTPTSTHGSSCGGSGCHGTAAGTTVTIALQTTTGSAVAHYTGGTTYNIVITGTSTSGIATLPKFGFQLCATNATGTANYGTYGTLPASVHKTATTASGFNYDIIEQSTQLSPTGSSYVETIPWTAPAAGTGAVVLHATLNAVNDNGTNDAADISGNTSLIVNEHTTAVAAVTNNMNITAFPNPTSGSLTVRFAEAVQGTCTVSVYDLNGRKIAGQDVQVNAAGDAVNINTATWAQGLYQAVIENNGTRQVIPVVKQ